MHRVTRLDPDPKLPKDAVYSRGIRAGDFVFVHGATGFDPVTRQIVPGGASAETAQALRRIDAVLQSAGASLANVVQATCYLKDWADVPAVNTAYRPFFPSTKPARTIVAVSSMDHDAAIEIAVIAYVPPDEP